MKERIIVLFGGRSAEHEVSVQSAVSVISNMDTKEFVPLPVGITKSGKWVAGLDPREMLFRGDRSVPLPLTGETNPIASILAQGDVVFPVLHGPYGEDGSMQGLLEVMDVPYVGSGVTSSALGMDKIFQKTIYRQMGIPVVDSVWTTDWSFANDPADFLLRVKEQLGFPCFVKPANMGSSVGINKALDEESLHRFILAALHYDRKVLVEKYAKGREIECSVLGNDQACASLPGEVVPNDDYYSYSAKYESPSRLYIPAVLTPQQIVQIQDLALKAYAALDCSGLARVDFFLTAAGVIYVNELNTMPGFTTISMYPKMWEASGVSYTSLISKLIRLAQAKYAEKRRISVNHKESF